MFLILTRRIGEKIMIGDDIEIVVLSQKGGQVRIGIYAPQEIAVHREEVYRRIQAEKEQEKIREKKPKVRIKKKRGK